MRAAVLRQYGHDNLTVEDVDSPVPGPGQVRLVVEAASINPVDWHRASGKPYLMRISDGVRRPKTERLGTDGAGVVDAVGPGVTSLAPGDRVFGAVDGSFAGQALASVDRVVRLPENVSFEDAAGVPVAGVTALEAVDRAEVRGRRVVVNGASGGVGSYAVQIARASGAAEVVGVCSARNRELVESLGADRVVDYETEDFTSTPFDVLIDCVGTSTPRRIKRAMAKDGVWVLLGSVKKGGLFGPLRQMVTAAMSFAFSTQRFVTFIAEETGPRLERLGQLLESGQVRTVVDRIVVLDVVGGAFDYLETMRARGKVLILPASSSSGDFRRL